MMTLQRTQTTHNPGSVRRLSPRQRGVSLLFALIALVALSLAVVGLVRTVGTGSLVVGNLGFKLDATATGDRGAELAISWLQSNLGGTTLDNDVPVAGYYATSLDALDPTGGNTTAATRAVVNWDGDNCASASGAFTACMLPATANVVGDNSVRWIITRLCATAGPQAAPNSCATSMTQGGGEDANSSGLTYSNPGGFGQAASTSPYFRIVVRTVGARRTVSFTETIIHF